MNNVIKSETGKMVRNPPLFSVGFVNTAQNKALFI